MKNRLDALRKEIKENIVMEREVQQDYEDEKQKNTQVINQIETLKKTIE